MNIVVRMPNWIGDAVMATPVLTDLRHHYPQACITLMCLDKIAPLFTADRDIDELFSFSKPNTWIPRQESRDLIGRLREGHYEMGLLLTNSFSSAWYFWRGRVERRIGFRAEYRSFLLTDSVLWPENGEHQHLVNSYKALLEPLGISVSDTRPRLFLEEHERKEVEELLSVQGVEPGTRLIGINPGAAYGMAKCWLPERFRQVAERLIRDSRNTVVFIGDAATSTLIKQICFGLSSQRVINLAGVTSLRQLIALIDRFDVLLTNDSGPMHVAAALKTPIVALFGSTSDVKTGPYGEATVIHKHVSCSPCYQKVCPIDFRCMTSIEVEEVYRAVVELLKPD